MLLEQALSVPGDVMLEAFKQQRQRTKAAEDKPTTSLLERHRAMVADRALGMTFAEIGEKYGISRQRAHQICRKSYNPDHHIHARGPR